MKRILLVLSASVFAVLLLLWWNGTEQSPAGTNEGNSPAAAEKPNWIKFPKLEYPAAEPATMPKLSLPVGEYLKFDGTLILNDIPEEGDEQPALVRLVKKRPGQKPIICQSTGNTLEKAEDGTYPINMGFEIPKDNRGERDLYLQVFYGIEDHLLFEAPVSVR